MALGLLNIAPVFSISAMSIRRHSDLGEGTSHASKICRAYAVQAVTFLDLCKAVTVPHWITYRSFGSAELVQSSASLVEPQRQEGEGEIRI